MLKLSSGRHISMWVAFLSSSLSSSFLIDFSWENSFKNHFHSKSCLRLWFQAWPKIMSKLNLISAVSRTKAEFLSQKAIFRRLFQPGLLCLKQTSKINYTSIRQYPQPWGSALNHKLLMFSKQLLHQQTVLN